MTLPFYTPNAQWLVPASQPLALLQGIQALVTLTGSGNRLGGGEDNWFRTAQYG